MTHENAAVLKDTPSPTLGGPGHDKLRTLRLEYHAMLPVRLAGIRDELARVRQGARNGRILVNFHRLLHNMSGSGASYGFHEISRAAGEVERFVRFLLDSGAPVEGSALQELDSLVDALAAQVEAAVEPESLPLPLPRPALTEVQSRVFLLEDDAATARSVREQLEGHGYEVVAFSQPAEILEAVRDELPDAMLLSMMLPDGESGPGIMRLLPAEISRRVPLIFVSANADIGARLAAVRAGAAAFLTKPLDVDAALEVLDHLTNRYLIEPFRILVVDDAPSVAALNATILEEAGMIVEVVTEPTETLDVIEKFRPELVLMDMYMPDIRGDELAGIIRQHPSWLSIPIVFLSVEGDESKQFRAVQAGGGDDFLTKSIEPVHLVSSVAARAQRYREMRSLMQRDGLTGLLNHSNSKERLEAELLRSSRSGNALTFALLDIDHFKEVNDTYGHPVGDRVLQSLARLMRQRLRRSDVVGRYGGEEFVVILPDTSARRAAAVLEELRLTFAALSHSAGGHRFTCTFSCGFAEAASGESREALTYRVDRALYEAKSAGRNRSVQAD
jgi:diguanylate cyclase (GGDEF)-like protein